jgi:hypothetical protein
MKNIRLLTAFFSIIPWFLGDSPLVKTIYHFEEQPIFVEIPTISYARFMPQISESEFSRINQVTATETLTYTATLTATSITETVTQTLTATMTITGTAPTPTTTMTITVTVQTPTVISTSGTATLSPTLPQVTPTQVSVDTPTPVSISTPTPIIPTAIPTVTPTLIPFPTLDFLSTRESVVGEFLSIQYEEKTLEILKHGISFKPQNFLRLLPLGILLVAWLLIGVWFLFTQKNS